MKVNSIDIENVKVAIFDFDGTLAIHKEKDFSKLRKKSEDKYLGYYLNAYQNPNNFYDDFEKCSKSEILYNFISSLRSKGVKIYCLSGTKFSFHLKAKQAFVNKHYGNDIEVIFTASQELKVDAVKIIQKINHSKLNEILFIDDKSNVIELLKNNGINSILVSDLEE